MCSSDLRIFDAKIGGVTALLMLLCDLNWQYSQTGLPQMFMLLLFSCACFFAYRAVEATEEGRIALVPALIAGAFFGLLALTHWMAIWIILGFAIYAGFFLRPRGAAGLSALVIVLLLSIWPLLKNKEYSGSIGGTAIFAVYNGLGTSEDEIMRTYDIGDTHLPLQNLPFKIVRTILLQAGALFVTLRSILPSPFSFQFVVAPSIVAGRAEVRPRPGNEFQVEEKFEPLGQPAQRVRLRPAPNVPQGLLLGRQGFEVVADPGEEDQVFGRVFGLIRRGGLAVRGCWAFLVGAGGLELEVIRGHLLGGEAGQAERPGSSSSAAAMASASASSGSAPEAMA